MFKQILWNFGILELSLLFVSFIYCSKDQVQVNKNSIKYPYLHTLFI